MRIGIDFGTSFSLPAAVINGAADTLLSNGEYGIPSVFYYDSEVGIQVGKAAEYNAEFCPMNVRRDIKMDICSHEDSFKVDGRTFGKKEIVGHILREVRRVAAEEGSRRELASRDIEGAVISVPAAFNLRELNFIRDAAQAAEEAGGANLNVLGFIREPVAAAIAYFHAPGARDKKTILVYDLGGGTCDIAIVRADRNAPAWYRVLESDMKRTGGRDWDRVLAEIIRRKLKEKTGETRFDEETEKRIIRQAVSVKHMLSTQTSARASVSLKGRMHSCLITVEEFEEATAFLLEDTMSVARRLVKECDTKVDYIVCVGGSSNMPQVRRSFEKEYPGIPVRIFQPEKAIALGAAIYANEMTNEHFLRDICKFSYGARYVENYDKYHDPNRFRIWNIIYKGGDLPAMGTSTSTRISGDADCTFIAIYESECTDEIYIPEKGTYIGDIRITGIKNGRRGDKTILTICIDRSGMMVLEAVDQRTGKKAQTSIQLRDF